MDNYETGNELMNIIYDEIEMKFEKMPFNYRGIKITNECIAATLVILGESNNNALPQNCRNQIKEKTPDGLDKRLKERLVTNLRMANILSDVLYKVGIVEVYKDENLTTGRMIKWTKLSSKWFELLEKH